MCRILIINSKYKISPTPYLEEFASICQSSSRPQGDGWGITSLEHGQWRVQKSTNSIWQNKNLLESVNPGKLFIIHARGASFLKHKNNIQYNQPFVNNNFCFAFNGFLNNVKLPYPIKGNIGSRKIFNLFLKLKSLAKTKKILIENSKIIESLNIAICNQKKIEVLNYYEHNPDYFRINYFQSNDLNLICSQTFGSYKWQAMKNGEIKKFNIK